MTDNGNYTPRAHPFLSSRATRSDHMATPKWLLDLLFPDGRFYDPCPLHGTGGLEAEWPTDIPIFLNPPYSDPGPWLRKLSEHNGPAVALVRADPSVLWWQYSEGFRVTFIGQRIRFGNNDDSASFPVAVWRKP